MFTAVRRVACQGRRDHGVAALRSRAAQTLVLVMTSALTAVALVTPQGSTAVGTALVMSAVLRGPIDRGARHRHRAAGRQRTGDGRHRRRPGLGRRVVPVANIVSGVTFDCVDPQRVARFWSALLGREPGPSEDGWVYLGHRGDPQPRLVFQPVRETKVGKVRIHLDVTVPDVNEAIDLVTALGGQFTGERHDYDEGAVVVMADPEGHEFCLVQYY
jgi:predicted enzyme related to lactoylglutathione lyase